MKTVVGIGQLDNLFAEAQRQRAISDDAFRQSLSGWFLSPAGLGDIPADPFSHAYRRFQLDLYRRLAGKEYATEFEETHFNPDQELRWPYPYSTRSARTVGGHLMAYGWLIKQLNLPSGAEILEVGSGYGSLTVHLANMGYQVTCLDISPALLAFVQKRTSALPTPVKTVCGDMATVEVEGAFDAVIFNASLHHSIEHQTVIERLGGWVKPEGVIALAAEPIVADDVDWIPYPWGLRLDGMSLWDICKSGWMELGFRESYIVSLLNSAGWHLTRHNPGLSELMDVWIASRGSGSLDSRTSAQAGRYAVNLEAEVARLSKLVEGYEQGRFIRFMRWLRRVR